MSLPIKQYGISMPKKSTGLLSNKPSVFGDDSNSDSDGVSKDWPKKTIRKESTQAPFKRQTKVDMDKALQQDSTVFQYDEVYDQLEQQRHANKEKVKDKERKPKYIQRLLVTAEKRKIENERRIERQVQREREAEGEEFKDKDTFVTSAYKKKLEEFAKFDKDQERMDMLEDIGDVRKQQDISGFYRHLYEVTVDNKNDKQEENQKRTYRKREGSSSDKDADDKKVVSSSSSSSSSSSDSGSDDEKSDSEDDEVENTDKNEPQKNETENGSSEIKIIENKVEEPIINVWEKRTVGKAFENALNRYLIRKHARLTVQ